jgi:hypothetical protein
MTTILPTGPNEYIDCGTSQVYDIVGADGKTRRVRIFAGSAAPQGGGQEPPDPLRSQADDGDDPPDQRPPASGGGLDIPDLGPGAAARIMAVVLGRTDVTDVRSEADLFVTPRIAGELIPGSSYHFPMWSISDAPAGRMSIMLPERHGEAVNGKVIFVPESGGW